MKLTVSNAIFENGIQGANGRLDIAKKQYEKDVEQIAKLTDNNNKQIVEIEKSK
jgi:hypothetical protein